MGNMPGKNFSEEALVKKLCDITTLTKSDAEWLLEWYPEMFEGFTELNELDARYSAAYGWGIQKMSEEELKEHFAEYADADGNIDDVPDGSIIRDAGLSGVVIVYGFAS